MRATPAARLAAAVIAYLVLMIAIITLAPFRFVGSPVNTFSLEWHVRDVVLNVVLFVPVGFTYQLGRARGSAAAWAPALLIGASISAAIEAAQLFAPARYPAVSDLVANALGAAVGAVFAARATRGTEGAQTVRAFALDLPLVGLIYLLVPILWLAGLSSRPGESAILLLPTVAAAWIIASVHASYSDAVDPRGARPLLRPAMAGALFVAIGFLPAAAFAPRVVPLAALVFAVSTAARLFAPSSLTHERLPDGRPSRRFEVPTLRFALAPLVAFIALHALWPLEPIGAAWHGTLALLPLGVAPDAPGVFRIMAQASAFAALGYLIAELGARAVDTMRGLAPRVLAAATVLAAPLEIVRGWKPGMVASALVFAISIAAAVFGAWLYLLQLRNVRALLGRDRDRAGSGAASAVVASAPSVPAAASRSTAE